MSAKNVMLPLWMRDVAIQVGLTSCENEGLTPPAGFNPEKFDDPRYQDTKDPYLAHFHSTVYNFCKEAYQHSLTPSGEMKSNPGSPQMSKDIYQYFKFFYGSDGFLEKQTPGLTALEKNEQIRQMKASVMHLSMLYLRLKAKKTKKDFVFPEKATEPDLRKAIVNRYYRMLVNASTHAILTSLFSTDPKEIDDFLKTVTFRAKDKKSGQEVTYNLATSHINELQSETARQTFAKMIYEMMLKKVEDSSVGSFLSENKALSHTRTNPKTKRKVIE